MYIVIESWLPNCFSVAFTPKCMPQMDLMWVMRSYREVRIAKFIACTKGCLAPPECNTDACPTN